MASVYLYMDLHYVDETLNDVNCRNNSVVLQTVSSIAEDKSYVEFRHKAPLHDPSNLKDMKLDDKGLYIMANLQCWYDKGVRIANMGYSCTITGKALHDHDKSKPLVLPFLISMGGHAHHNDFPAARVTIHFQKIGPLYYISQVILDVPTAQYMLCGETLKKMNIPYFSELILQDVKNMS